MLCLSVQQLSLFLDLNCWVASFRNVILDPVGSRRVLQTLSASPLLLVITFNWGPVSGGVGDSRSASESWENVGWARVSEEANSNLSVCWVGLLF